MCRVDYEPRGKQHCTVFTAHFIVTCSQCAVVKTHIIVKYSQCAVLTTNLVESSHCTVFTAHFIVTCSQCAVVKTHIIVKYSQCAVLTTTSSRKPSLYRVHGSLHRDMQPICRGQNAHNRQIQPMCRVDYNLFAEAVIVPCSRLTSS
ncbi:hypothetical protein KIN20_007965 [Parelaphostrongylus tenuis]|uniref:Uncharacterized protein n=1 Tax=Parelaphostrongylus tenuis TaxID=148309 RepID=A0AAD5MQC1_PARTN|nr:hypothetical protein KIN20_007965 [Parelaphostrongylus tenuis]